MKVDDTLEFEGVLKIADVVDGNKCSYTPECLESAYKEYRDSGRQLFGAVFSPGLPMPIPLSEVAFTVKELKLKGGLVEGEPASLQARCIPLQTPRGKDLMRLLECERDHPGTFSVGMAVYAEETEEKGGVLVVKKCKIERLSVVKAEDKA
jgi:hypothetical protein